MNGPGGPVAGQPGRGPADRPDAGRGGTDAGRGGTPVPSRGDAGAGAPATTGGGRDAGLQPERTRLAWRRTGLALTVVTVLAVRAAAELGVAAAFAAAAVAAVVWGNLLLLIRRRSRVLGASHRPGLPAAVVPATALAIVGYAVAGLVMLAVQAAR